MPLLIVAPTPLAVNNDTTIKKCRADLEELPPKTRRSMTCVTLESMDEVLVTALVAKEKGVGASGAGDTTPAASPT